VTRRVGLTVGAVRSRNCRNSLASPRLRRLETQWLNAIRHATIEKDPEKMLRLADKLDRSRAQPETVSIPNCRM
jgi:hypothetical protein